MCSLGRPFSKNISSIALAVPLKVMWEARSPRYFVQATRSLPARADPKPILFRACVKCGEKEKKKNNCALRALLLDLDGFTPCRCSRAIIAGSPMPPKGTPGIDTVEQAAGRARDVPSARRAPAGLEARATLFACQAGARAPRLAVAQAWCGGLYHARLLWFGRRDALLFLS